MSRGTLSVLLSIVVLPACLEKESGPSSSHEINEVVVIAPSVTIGETEGDPAYLFGDIRAVALDDLGRVYVGDRIGATVRAYSREGEFLSELAREGQGPGEVDGWPAHLAFGPAGRLYVRDDSRITVFAPAEPGSVPDSLAEVWTLHMYGNLTEDRSRVDEKGIYYYPGGLYRPEPSFFYMVIDSGAILGDTLRVPTYPGMTANRPAFYSLGGGNGRLLDGFSRAPFSPVPSWDVTSRGNLISTSGARPELIETTLAGDTVRLILLEDSLPRPVPAAEREDSLRALEERIDSLPVPLEEVIGLGEGISDRTLPTVLPFILSVSVATDDRLWVERWPPVGRPNVRRFDVLKLDGEKLTTVELDAPLVSDVPLYFGRNAIVGVIRDEITGVERVVRFDVELPNGFPAR